MPDLGYSVLIDDGAPMTADGAPQDLQAGAHINRIYSEISELRKEQVEQGKALARIEGKLSEQKDEGNKTNNWRNSIFVAGITSIATVLSTVLLLRGH